MNIICVQTLAFDHFVFRLKTEVWMRKMNARALFIAGHKPTNSSFYSTLPLRSGPGVPPVMRRTRNIFGKFSAAKLKKWRLRVVFSNIANSHVQVGDNFEYKSCDLVLLK